MVAGDLGLTSEDEARGKRFAENGYFVFDSALPPEMAMRLKGEVDAAFDDPRRCLDLGKGLIRLIDGSQAFPEIITALQGNVEGTLKAFYRSEFKVYAVSVYRTVPNDEDDRSSFLWHLDNCPREEVKFMVYLDEVAEANGAFRLKPKSLSDAMLHDGFWDRARVENFATTLGDDQSTVVFEQKPGDAILFMNSACIHKATSPRAGHRDVANFVIIPSDLGWREHYSRNAHLLSTNAGICRNPYRDEPEMVGYRY